MISNFHCHTSFCDGVATVAEVAAAARQQQLTSLGISSHAPLPTKTTWSMATEDLPVYLQQIAALKNTSATQLYAGLEVDYMPHKTGPEKFRGQVDYIIGSIHFVEAFANGIGWEIDGPNDFFQQGLDEIFKGNLREAVCRYFELTREMVSHSRPDIVGHLDKIKLQNSYAPYFDEADKWYQQQVVQTLACIEKYGCMIEVNTRGLYQRKTTEPYPSAWALEKILSMKIPIVLNSDAHHPRDLLSGFEAARALLQRIGFSHTQVLWNGTWLTSPLDAPALS